MKPVRGHLICIDDEYDRAVMLEEGLEIVQRKLGNFPNELLRDVVDATTPTQAQALIDRLYGRANSMRTAAKHARSAAHRVEHTVHIPVFNDWADNKGLID